MQTQARETHREFLQRDPTIREALARYIETNARIGSEQTGRRYKTTVSNFSRFVGRAARVSDLTEENFGAFVQRRREENAAVGTVRGDAEKLLVLWRWAAEKLGQETPKPALPANASTVPVTWWVEEFEKLDRAARECEWFVGQTPAKLYWPAMIGVAVDTGERRHAIYELRREDIDLIKQTAYFRRETRKGASSDARKPISKQTASDLAALMDWTNRTQPFAALKPNSLYHPMRRLLVEAGLPSGRNRMFHCLRKYHATQLTIAGADATSSLGHSSPTITRKSYIDPDQLSRTLPRRKAGWSMFSWVARLLRG